MKYLNKVKLVFLNSTGTVYLLSGFLTFLFWSSLTDLLSLACVSFPCSLYFSLCHLSLCVCVCVLAIRCIFDPCSHLWCLCWGRSSGLHANPSRRRCCRWVTGHVYICDCVASVCVNGCIFVWMFVCVCLAVFQCSVHPFVYLLLCMESVLIPLLWAGVPRNVMLLVVSRHGWCCYHGDWCWSYYENSGWPQHARFRLRLPFLW